jgi:dUTP pyrophosphatase
MIRYFLASSHLTLERGSLGASGYDLKYAGDSKVTLLPGQRKPLSTGLYLDMPLGIEGQVRPRSGLAAREGLTVLNTPGTIDSDYRGEVLVILINLSEARYEIEPGQRIAQIVFAPIFPWRLRDEDITWIRDEPVRVATHDELTKTLRGDGRFGSTGT